MRESITSNAILRLIQDARSNPSQTVRLSNLIYDEVRAKLTFHLEDVLKIVCIFTEEGKHRTIMKKHVYPSLAYIPTIVRKTTKSCTKRETDCCFYFAREPFRNLVRDITKGNFGDFRFSEEALVLIQMNAEHYLSSMAKHAISSMTGSGRHTLFPKDLQAADRQLCKKKKSFAVVRMSKSVSFDGSIDNAMGESSYYSISDGAKERINMILNVVAQTIVKIACEMCEISDRKSMSFRSIMHAVRVIFPDNLGKHALRASTNIDKLVFEMKPVEKVMRSSTDLTVTRDSLDALASVLEYLTYELLDLSIDSVKTREIGSKNLNDAIINDEELAEMVSALNIYIV